MQLVPVLDKDGKALMPCHPARARELVKKGKAVRRFKAGLFYIQLVDRKDGNTQEVVVGIDPGSKREAFTVKSKAHTLLNVLSDAVTGVKEKMEVRRNMRRARRSRKTPYRKCRWNRKIGGIPPSTKARWQAKLRIVNILRKLYPITAYIVEDIKAKTKGKRRWDVSFSPLEVGKEWFYTELKKLGTLKLVRGYETFELRKKYSLKKTNKKLSEIFEAHNVDSWVLANDWVGGHNKPENIKLIRMIPLKFYRRQLYKMQPQKGGKYVRQGSTMSLGFKRGSIVKHKRYGVCYIGGNMKDKLTIHSINSGDRLARNIKVVDIKFSIPNVWRVKICSTTR